MSIVDDVRKIFSKASILCRRKAIIVRYLPEDNVTDQIIYDIDNRLFIDLLGQIDSFSSRIIAGSSIDLILETQKELPPASFYPVQDNVNDELDYENNPIANIFGSVENDDDELGISLDLTATMEDNIEANNPDKEIINHFNNLFFECRNLAETVNAKFEIQPPDNIFDGFALFAFDSNKIKVSRYDMIEIEILKRILLASSEFDIIIYVKDGWFFILVLCMSVSI